MTECSINLKLSTDDSEKSIQLIRGFHALHGLDSDDLDTIHMTMSSCFGESFTEIMYAEVYTAEHIKRFAPFLKKELIDDVETFIYKLQFRACNEKRLWQDSSSGNPDMRELSPADIRLHTTSEPAGGSTWERLELYYDSDENFLLKAVVFAAAFKSIGFDIDEISSYDDYEDEYEDDEEDPQAN